MALPRGLSPSSRRSFLGNPPKHAWRMETVQVPGAEAEFILVQYNCPNVSVGAEAASSREMSSPLYPSLLSGNPHFARVRPGPPQTLCGRHLAAALAGGSERMVLAAGGAFAS